MTMVAIESVRKRLAEVVGAVARQALADRGVGRIALLDDGGPEAALAAEWLAAALPVDATLRISSPHPGLEPLLQTSADDLPSRTIREEALRLRVRLTPDALAAHPANKTALLLGGPWPPEPLLPLGDLYASEIEALTGSWSAPETVMAAAARAGGVAALDAALRERFDHRNADGLARLAPPLRAEVEAHLARGAACRSAAHLVPKLGNRTLGVDLFE